LASIRSKSAKHAVEVRAGLVSGQGLENRTRAEIVQMLGGALSARVRYDLGRDLAYGAERFDAEPMPRDDRVGRWVEACRPPVLGPLAHRTRASGDGRGNSPGWRSMKSA
jgi:hypothetical protein